MCVWHSRIRQNSKNLIKTIFQVCRDGAWVEDKGVLMTFHYREVDVEKREPLITRAKQLIKDAGYKVEELCFNFSIAFFGSFIQSSIEIQYKNY